MPNAPMSGAGARSAEASAPLAGWAAQPQSLLSYCWPDDPSERPLYAAVSFSRDSFGRDKAQTRATFIMSTCHGSWNWRAGPWGELGRVVSKPNIRFRRSIARPWYSINEHALFLIRHSLDEHPCVSGWVGQSGLCFWSMVVAEVFERWVRQVTTGQRMTS